MIIPPIEPGVSDPKTRRALFKLEASRERVVEWAEADAARRTRHAPSVFSPRSATMRALLSFGAMRLPWLRWGVSAFLMFRSFRRR